MRSFFGLQRLVVVAFKSRLRVQAIERGTYSYVFGVTAFVSHSVDRVAIEACQKSGAMYVRVNHGRLTACCVALARALGLTLPGHGTG